MSLISLAADRISALEVIEGEIAAASQTYRDVQQRIAALTLVQTLLAVVAEHPNARYVGLGDGDQDSTGYQWTHAIVDAEGTLLADPEQTQEVLADVAISNLDDRNEGTWSPYTHLSSPLAIPGLCCGEQRWLDLGLVARDANVLLHKVR